MSVRPSSSALFLSFFSDSIWGRCFYETKKADRMSPIRFFRWFAYCAGVPFLPHQAPIDMAAPTTMNTVDMPSKNPTMKLSMLVKRFRIRIVMSMESPNGSRNMYRCSMVLMAKEVLYFYSVILTR